MNKTNFLAVIAIVFMVQLPAHSQSPDLRKFEVAGEFTTIEWEEVIGPNGTKRTQPGFGGRFTYNLNQVFSLEGAGYFFPKGCFTCADPGRLVQVVGGVKVGKRFDTWGVFAKVRPGVIRNDASFGGIVTCLNLTCPIPVEPFIPPLKHFATDIGGVVEFYPSKRIVIRFDAGDTMVYFPRQTFDGLAFNFRTNTFEPFLFVSPARTAHNFQIFTSVGFRF